MILSYFLFNTILKRKSWDFCHYYCQSDNALRFMRKQTRHHECYTKKRIFWKVVKHRSFVSTNLTCHYLKSLLHVFDNTINNAFDNSIDLFLFSWFLNFDVFMWMNWFYFCLWFYDIWCSFHWDSYFESHVKSTFSLDFRIIFQISEH
jgi:hypothetical protein